jgi:hypothetical protein
LLHLPNLNNFKPSFGCFMLFWLEFQTICELLLFEHILNPGHLGE